MKQQDKELLLKDLCARLPYEVMCDIGLDHPLLLQSIFVDRFDGILLDFYDDNKDYQVYLSEVKPYLRPMSSMTDEEKLEFFNMRINHIHLMKLRSVEDIDSLKKITFIVHPNDYKEYKLTIHEYYGNYDYFDWLYKHHIDFRGLIEKDLALKAPEGMYI